MKAVQLESNVFSFSFHFINYLTRFSPIPYSVSVFSIEQMTSTIVPSVASSSQGECACCIMGGNDTKVCLLAKNLSKISEAYDQAKKSFDILLATCSMVEPEKSNVYAAIKTINDRFVATLNRFEYFLGKDGTSE